MLGVAFEAAYEREFARIIPRAEIEVLSWSLTASTEPPLPEMAAAVPSPHQARASGSRSVIDPATGKAALVPVYARAELAPGAGFAGPALVVEAATTTFVS